MVSQREIRLVPLKRARESQTPRGSARVLNVWDAICVRGHRGRRSRVIVGDKEMEGLMETTAGVVERVWTEVSTAYWRYAKGSQSPGARTKAEHCGRTYAIMP